EISKELLIRQGEIRRENKRGGIINAEVQGAGVVLKFKALTPKTTQLTISARKFMLPKRAIASGILYQIAQEMQ
ncbi:MAG: hypothetical protein KKC84_07855, partial [Candidatus Omnitrophica bacterium]|nr:hypothetical protein [Candidatus Omnitrophota bacterium]